jgi:8-oxo-dGTP pyrophosphatase MutT (NUDIX family)
MANRDARRDELVQDLSAPRPVTERDVAFRGRVWDVVTEHVRLDANVVVARDVIRHPGAVAIVAFREPGEVLLVRQYRHPVGREMWEPPAGLLDVAGEDPLAAAKRELHEEADVVATMWHVLADFFTSPGGSSEAIRIYLARDISEVPHADRFVREAEERDMIRRWVALEEVLAGIAAGELQSPTLVTGAFALDAARRSAFATLRPADAPWARSSGVLS